jgi:hypothetical protein
MTETQYRVITDERTDDGFVTSITEIASTWSDDGYRVYARNGTMIDQS